MNKEQCGLPLLEVKNLKKYFHNRRGSFAGAGADVKAVDRVSLRIYPGETLGLVGESGCGKTTLGRISVRLETPTGGDVFFQGRNIVEMEGAGLKEFRREVQMIFQDPYSSLNPRKSAGCMIGEPLAIHGLCSRKDRQARVSELMEKVGLTREQMDRYPHEFSGGQRQRIGIARALALRPKLIIADEPVSALDVSIQAQILNLLMDLQGEFRLTYLFISHDLGVVRHMCNRIAVMYLGRIVEEAESEDLFKNPLHPYTRALLAAIPSAPDASARSFKGPGQGRSIPEGEASSPGTEAGCAFRPRCPERKDACAENPPELTDLGGGHFVSCHLKGI